MGDSLPHSLVKPVLQIPLLGLLCVARPTGVMVTSDRRGPARLGLALLVIVFALGLLAPVQAVSASKPNLIFILSDDLARAMSALTARS